MERNTKNNNLILISAFVLIATLTLSFTSYSMSYGISIGADRCPVTVIYIPSSDRSNIGSYLSDINSTRSVIGLFSFGMTAEHPVTNSGSNRLLVAQGFVSNGTVIGTNSTEPGIVTILAQARNSSAFQTSGSKSAAPDIVFGLFFNKTAITDGARKLISTKDFPNGLWGTVSLSELVHNNKSEDITENNFRTIVTELLKRGVHVNCKNSDSSIVLIPANPEN
jgi:hypothetical protein